MLRKRSSTKNRLNALTSKRQKDGDNEALSPEDLVDLVEPKNLLKRGLRFASNLYRKSPRVFALSVLLVIIAMAAIRLIGLDPLFFVPVLSPVGQSVSSLPVLRRGSWIPEVKSRMACIAKAKELHRQYVLENVVQLVQYENELGSAGPVRRVHERITYRVLPLQDIKESDQIFLEEYQSSHLTSHWLGPYREIPEGGGGKYQVAFSAKRGEPITLMTGAELEFALPLADGRSAFRGQITVNHDADFWFYENIDDVICDLTQVVESRTLRLVPVGRGGLRLGIAPKTEADVIYQASPSIAASNSSLLLKWDTLLPGEDAGVVFKW
jgi:hypothetical protein